VKPVRIEGVASTKDESAAASHTPKPDDDDWFGEGSFFESGEGLAAALFALAGTVDPAAGGQVPPVATVLSSSAEAGFDDEGLFEVLQPLSGNGAGHAAPAVGTTAPSSSPRAWSVRTPGSLLLPPRRPGRSGWSIRNSVQVLHRTEDAMSSLREQAVTSTFMAAAEVFRLSAPPLESRRARRRR
jgi:hypothetical protein